MINASNKMNNLNNLKSDVESIDFSGIEWKGFRKTTKNIISKINIKKISIEKLCVELGKIYSNYKEVDIGEIDESLIKKNMMDKIEDSDSYVIDLGKSTIRLK